MFTAVRSTSVEVMLVKISRVPKCNIYTVAHHRRVYVKTIS